ncbi:MTOR-associated protein MEAK7 [Cylas formicarius]|uniref:MTOR-associated protein MEAK7 n=1 Tax=Cylas formicarius TaxID=197179 RepID=UPI0029584EA4|nr:MTOR-associated protein MEAK7 [Cylas formicarius]XP_060536322.1 MTOR-associated protein MEAK7 [Cylas formicarius]XP_060536323.1 MTOR-associated protein MEAK7 [Cylas formicarius]
MGVNNSKKLAAKCSFLSKDEQLIVSNSFKLASRNSEKIKEEELTKLWGSQMDPRLLQYINNYLFGMGEQRLNTVDLERFAELFVFCTRGTVDEKVKVLLTSLGKSDGECGDIPYILVKEYVESIVSSYMKIQRLSGTKQYKSWAGRGCMAHAQNAQRLAESLTRDLAGENVISRKSIEMWLQGSTILGQLLLFVFMHLYNISHKDKTAVISEKQQPAGAETELSTNESENSRERSLVPYCRGLDLIPSYPSILDLNQIVFVNANLPQQYQLEWRFLFSSEIHGESFSTLIGRIVNQGPSVLVLEDRNGYVFGGFAPANWALGPNFFGDDSSFLFTLAPRMRIYPSTGYNQHFQYLNLHQQTMPNGLALGGQHNYCGLWIDSEYGNGHSSESCTTYAGYQQMSHSKEFHFRHLEVWGLGLPPPTPQERGERVTTKSGSVLDANVESKAMLKMAGKQIHSEGLREPPNV